MLKKLFSSNYGILCAAVLFFAFVLLALHFRAGGQAAGGTDSFAYYLDFGLASAKRITIWTTLVLFSLLLIKTFIFYSTSFKKRRDKTNGIALNQKSLLVRATKSFYRELKEIIKTAAMLAVILFLSITALAKINFLNRTHLKDEVLLKIDHLLTGGYPFIFLHSLKYPAWFVSAVAFCFLNLPLFLIIAAVYFFWKNKTTFFKYASAFALGLAFLFAVWILVPALSPQDRFIDNVYKLPIPSEISGALAHYSPQPEIRNFLLKERAYKNGLTDMSTSTMPSAHVFWAFILGYYLFRKNKKLFGLVLPILILSSIGTVFFAQHYFVDVPAAVLVGIFSVALTEIYFNHHRRRET